MGDVMQLMEKFLLVQLAYKNEMDWKEVSEQFKKHPFIPFSLTKSECELEYQRLVAEYGQKRKKDVDAQKNIMLALFEARKKELTELIAEDELKLRKIYNKTEDFEIEQMPPVEPVSDDIDASALKSTVINEGEFVDVLADDRQKSIFEENLVAEPIARSSMRQVISPGISASSTPDSENVNIASIWKEISELRYSSIVNFSYLPKEFNSIVKYPVLPTSLKHRVHVNYFYL